ncbi:MAG: efflux RND transporter periplasmic adaptor subunit [Burkholderiales bacterium]|nr:efflux RND transporter periplasmic adaptor subunit [Burkholderiales bacterium]
MNLKHLLIGAVAVALVGAAGYGLYATGLQRGKALAGAPAAGGRATAPAAPSGAGPAPAGLRAGDIDPANGKKILYYHDPMVPATRFDKPGKSPFMDMMLVPVYADNAADTNQVGVSPRMQQSLGVRTALVTEGELAPQVSAVGAIAFDERDQAIVQARATGYVEHLYVRATLDPVAAGQPLVDLYVPDWIAAQEEFLAVRRMQGPDLAVLVDGARQRMRQAGMSEAQIRLVETTGKTQPRLTLVAPIGGVVVELLARQGMTVMPGATLFRINGLASVWANAQVPESQSALLRPGARVQATSPSLPGTTFSGTVQAILPDVNTATRTLTARMELANPGHRLLPGMFVQMQLTDTRADTRAARTLLVPSEAVIQTGRRAVVMLADDHGGFRPVDVQTGLESGGRTEILHGLQAGQKVVASGQFLIDSEASLRGVEARMEGAGPAASASVAAAAANATAAAGFAGSVAPAAPAAATASAPLHVGEGRVDNIGTDALTLSHGPIASMKWGAMTMDFKLPASGAPRGLRVGDRVRFEFVIGKDDLPQLTSVTPATAQTAAQPAAPPAASAASAGGAR